MTPEQAKKLPKYTPNPVFKGMPGYLKDPTNYETIQRTLLETLASRHSHGEMQTWANCINCQKKMMDHKVAMKKLGFTSGAQYMMWKKVMDIIINKKRDELPKYNDK